MAKYRMKTKPKGLLNLIFRFYNDTNQIKRLYSTFPFVCIVIISWDFGFHPLFL